MIYICEYINNIRFNLVDNIRFNYKKRWLPWQKPVFTGQFITVVITIGDKSLFNHIVCVHMCVCMYA